MKPLITAAAIGALLMGTAAADDLPERLSLHVRHVAGAERNTAKPAALEQAARYIEDTLSAIGYEVQRQEYEAAGQRVRNLEVSIKSPLAGKQRILIVGAHYDSAPGSPGANDNGSGAAALIELARMLRHVQPGPGTELKFVFFVNEEAPWFMSEGMGSLQHARALKDAGHKVEAALILETIGYYSDARGSQRYPLGLAPFFPDRGNFIAFVGTLGSRALVASTLDAFRAASSFPAEGLAAPGFVTGVTWSDHSSYNRFGYPALMITDTAFMRYPHYHTAQDTPDKLDYPRMARVVEGLARVVESMAAPAASAGQ